jgi:hypothetical protein
MMRLTGAMLLWVAAAECLACSSTSSGAPCPYTIVSTDAAVDGFAGVGDYKMGDVCLQFCDTAHPVCELAAPQQVKCQEGCQ